MTFTKTSQKFGQWSDVKANTVYGLGFSSEDELLKVLLLYSMLKHFSAIGCENSSCNVIDQLISWWYLNSFKAVLFAFVSTM